MSPYIHKGHVDEHRCQGSDVVVWNGGEMEPPPYRLWCPACGRETVSEIKRWGKDVTASVGIHDEEKALTWIFSHIKVLSCVLCVLVLLLLISTFNDQYFSVGGSWSSAVITRPLTMLLGSRCVTMYEDGQWDNKVEFVERSWWGITEHRYPMRFSRNFDYHEGIMMWEIQVEGQWRPFWQYPEDF